MDTTTVVSLRKQRSVEAVSRRDFLRAAGAVAGVGGTTALSGCAGTQAAGAPVTVLAAGSLQRALETGLDSAVDVPVQVETHGSATVARMVAEGQRDPDIVTVADTALFEGVLSPAWYSVFTSNAVVLAYNPETEGGERVERAGPERWYEPLLDDVDLGRTDPDQDPLGYRTLFALELASRYYGVPALREQVPAREQVYPETSLLTQFETGAIEAAFAYRNMAVERDYDYVDLPGEVDLSDPGHRERYATVTYELPGGQVVRGGPIGYASTLRRVTEGTLAVFEAHTTGSYLEDSGFLVREGFPRYEGAVPDAVARAVGSDSGTAGRGGETPAGAVREVSD